MTIEEKIEDYKKWTVEYNGNEPTTSPHYVLSLSFESENNYYDVFKKHCQELFGIKKTLFEVEDPVFFEQIKNSIEGMEEYKPFVKKYTDKRLDGGFLQSGLGSYLKYLDYKVLGHRTFIFPCNPKQYDCIECFKNNSTVDWRQNITKCNEGDIVYIYLTTPYQEIKFKTVIERVKIPYDKISKNDFQYYTDPKYIPQKPEQKFVRLRLLETYEENSISLQKLKDLGLSYNIQGQGLISNTFVQKIEKELSPNHPRGMFNSWEVLSDNVVLKHTDKSFFDYRGSGVPKEIRWFFGSEDLIYPDRVSIILNYKGKTYEKCYVSTEPVMNRTRIFWETTLGKEFISILEQNPDTQLVLRFSKISNNTYDVGFLNLDVVEKETDCPRENEIPNDTEGRKVSYWTTRYERSSSNRKKTIERFGTKCMVCEFDFEETYGEVGRDFIEVHHIKPLSSRNEEVVINPETDLVCLCSNCHSMIHRNKKKVLSIEELKECIKK